MRQRQRSLLTKPVYNMREDVVLTTDFDGTITYLELDGIRYDFPKVGPIRPGFLKCYHKAKSMGYRWSLNTMRHDNDLVKAVAVLCFMGVEFDCICSNPQDLIDKYGECRKIAGTIYFEDRTFPQMDMDVVWEKFYKYLCHIENERKRVEERKMRNGHRVRDATDKSRPTQAH